MCDQPQVCDAEFYINDDTGGVIVVHEDSCTEVVAGDQSKLHMTRTEFETQRDFGMYGGYRND